MIVLILEAVALVLAAIALFQSKGQSLVAFAVALIALALLIEGNLL